MSSEQDATTRWVILVDGTQLASVEPGTTVEIGRKPLRPLPNDGKRRVEILDDSRSVSKGMPSSWWRSMAVPFCVT